MNKFYLNNLKTFKKGIFHFSSKPSKKETPNILKQDPIIENEKEKPSVNNEEVPIKKNLRNNTLDSLPEKKYSLDILKKLTNEIENTLQNSSIYKVKDEKCMIPNNITKIPLYRMARPLPINYLNSNIETQGVTLITLITFMNYHSMIFPSLYLFNYLLLVNFFAVSKLFWSSCFMKEFIYEINIINDKRVEVVYMDGNSEQTAIEHIYLTNKMKETLTLHEAGREPKMMTTNIEVRVKGSNTAFILLHEDERLNGLVNLEPLMAVLNKKTRQLM